MRPRGNTQRIYNEAIQILSGTRVKKQNISSELNDSAKLMAMKRRQACTQTVLHLWDAIAYIRQQKQIPNFDRLSAYMKRVYDLSLTDCERQLKFAVSDGLIIVKKSIGCKGSKIGFEQDGYRVPEEVDDQDGHDWYCFECHQGGEVIMCTTCHRVYHQDCLSESSGSGKFVCLACKNVERFTLNVKKNELNTLLSYTCVRLKEKTRELHRIPHPDDEKWRFNFLIREPMDLNVMEEKMKSNEYLKLGDFYTDAQQIVHNVAVYFGLESRIAGMAQQMLGDCEYDLLEITQCSDCYKMSNTKADSLWFCQPCDPPHELVYAKMKGFPYWPAKVIKKSEDYYDVRFFGAFHQRALIHEDHIKPITTPYKKLGIKYTPSFNRAYKELTHHQQLVEGASRKRSASNKSQTEKSIEDKADNDNNTNDKSSLKPKPTPTRKRKSSATSLSKPPSAKKTATVPVKKNKKFYQESPSSSSPKNTTFEVDSVPEDHNLVSSSQDTSVFHVSAGVQTEPLLLEENSSSKKSKESGEKTENSCSCSEKYDTIVKNLQSQLDSAHKEDKTKSPKEYSGKSLLPEENTSSQKSGESNEKTENSCNCSEKYETRIKSLQSQLDSINKEDKSKSLKDYSKKIQVELEAEKQKNLALAIEKLKQEHKEAQAKAIKQLKLAHTQEICGIIDRHNKELSDTKKKQWCYNCEAEAIYHCCWNTSYCSVECQQVHWHKEHKRTCRRKR